MDGDDSLARTALGVAAACGAHWKHFKAVFRELLIWAFLDREGANATRTRIMIASSFMERCVAFCDDPFLQRHDKQ